jgi:hypothetical protein
VVEKRLTVEKILRLCKYKGDLPLIEENTIGGLFRVGSDSPSRSEGEFLLEAPNEDPFSKYYLLPLHFYLQSSRGFESNG